MSNERIKELESIINSADQAYYNLSPIMGDQEYDAIKEQLKSLDVKNNLFKKVGAEVKQTAWEKVEHTMQMGSLDKVNSVEEFEKWAQKTNSKDFLITHKIDGSSLELVYVNGVLSKAITRGDGITGENILENAMKVVGIKHNIQVPAKWSGKEVCVRGEVVMFKKVFNEKYSDQYANPRNTANGKIKERKNGGADCENLNFIAYTVFTDDSGIKTEKDQFAILEKLRFMVPESCVGTKDEVINHFNISKDNRDEIYYEIDGMVVRVNDIAKQEELGILNMRPVGQTAWKFDPVMGITNVISIKWQVSGTGRVTPVASVEPVSIGGVTITSISLHNINMFKELDLSEGCKVLVSRRNDVIPYIEKKL